MNAYGVTYWDTPRRYNRGDQRRAPPMTQLRLVYSKNVKGSTEASSKKRGRPPTTRSRSSQEDLLRKLMTLKRAKPIAARMVESLVDGLLKRSG